MSSMAENLAPKTLKSVVKELARLTKTPPEGIRMHEVDESDISEIQASIIGPEDTPYDGGEFKLKLVLPSDFPQAPPKGYFITKIFHPNVASDGSICVGTLKRDWKPEYNIGHVLTIIRHLLIFPNPASALNEEAGKLLLEQYEDFASRAKMWTEIYAGAKAGSSASSAAPAAASADAADGASKKRAVDKKAKKKADKRRTLKRL